jgi:F-type H+-transporting ATPase subunit gamma
MSSRHDIESRLEGLADIGKIMRSMKNLSYMETRKLGRFLDAQHRVVDSIDAAARDFLAHYSGIGPEIGPEMHRGPARTAAGRTTLCYLLIGAERGFCGDFNEAVLRALEREASGSRSAADLGLIAVGTRLAAALDKDPRLLAALPGASAAEDVAPLLPRLADSINAAAAGRPTLRLTALYWSDEADAVVRVPLLPPFTREPAGTPPAYPYPPLLNLPPAEFLRRLVEHYLFAALHELLYSSLMAEHQHRLRHLESALRRVDERVHALELRRNLSRQEEITEEIELILLNRPAPRH